MKTRNLICGILIFSLILTMTGCGKKYESPTRSDTKYSDTTNSGRSDTAKTETRRDYASPTQGPVTEEYPILHYKDAAYVEHYDFDYNGLNTEEYSSVHESGFLSTSLSPLSTFAADVDTASYSNFRRFVNDGCALEDIPAGAIRTEEMINYFRYDYEKPDGDEPFGVTTVVGDCPWNEEAKLLSIGITTNDMNSRDIPSANIVFLIDVSGSMMSSNKLPLIQDSLNLLINKFDSDDRISIVTYASGTDVVLDGEHGDRHKKISNAIDSLKAGGSTNGSGGIELAYKTAERNFIEDGVNRIIICSDGDFNVGLTSESELEKLISEKKKSGIFLSVLGFGMYNYSDTTMETLADCGNGNYGYIDTLAEAHKILVEEMTSTFVTVAKDVKFQVEFNPATVSKYRLVGYENRAMADEDFIDDTKDGGELGAGHQVTVLYELILADEANNGIKLKYQNTNISDKGASGDEYCTLSIAYKAPEGNRSHYLSYPIGIDNYTDDPSDDFLFAACVAEASLALRNSDYLVDVSPMRALKNISNYLSERNDLDEYQSEFEALVSVLKKR